MRRFFIILLLIAVLLPVRPARAQAAAAADLIAAVNAVRASSGLQPYQVDGGLMSLAQTHSEYQASIAQTTHTRADGTGPAELGVIENVCGGLNMGVDYVVETCWQDSLHRSTLVGPTSGFAGAGVAVRDGVVYYTLAVKRTGGFSDAVPAAPTAALAQAQATPDPSQVAGQAIQGVQVSTPQPDGAILHEVTSGESAWSIALAYNITVAELVAMNGLAPTPVIFAGQKLVVRPSFTPTLSPTVTKTPRPPTRTPTLTRTPRPPSATPTLTLTPTATPFNILSALPPLEGAARQNLAVGLIAVCGLGLLAVLWTSLRKR